MEPEMDSHIANLTWYISDSPTIYIFLIKMYIMSGTRLLSVSFNVIGTEQELIKRCHGVKVLRHYKKSTISNSKVYKMTGFLIFSACCGTQSKFLTSA